MKLLHTMAWLMGWGACFTAFPLVAYGALSQFYRLVAADVLYDPLWTPAILLALSAFIAGALSRELADLAPVGHDGLSMLPLMLAAQLVFAWWVSQLSWAAFSPLLLALGLPLVGLAGVLSAPRVSLLRK